jgi:hypothetical protein
MAIVPSRASMYRHLSPQTVQDLQEHVLKGNFPFLQAFCAKKSGR